MKPENIFELMLGQKIWHKGKQKAIMFLGYDFSYSLTQIQFSKELITYSWRDICSDCSLEPPRQAEKITLFRYTYRRPDNREISQTNWTDCSWGLYFNSLYGTADLLKTEEKTVEL